MAERISRRLSYRRAAISKKGHTLHDVLRAALKGLKKAKDRIEPLGPAAGSPQRLINYFMLGPVIMGEMVIFEPGRAREIISSDPDAEFLPQEAVPPPLKNGKPQQYIDSVLHFGVAQNHVVVCESRGLRASALERHLDWLLRSRTNALESDGHVRLDQTFTKGTAEKVRKAGVKSITLRRPLIDDAVPVGQQPAKGTKLVLQPRGIGLDALKAFLGDHVGRLSRLRLDKLMDPESLELSVELRVKQRSEEAMRIATEIVSLANIDPAEESDQDVEIELADRTRIKHGEMMPYHFVRVSARDGIPERSELWEGMRDWLVQLVE